MFKTNYNYDFKENQKSEVYNNPSLTQPDMTYKIRDIIKRSQQGQFIPTIQGNYDEDGQLLAIRRPQFDLTDIDTIKNSISELNKVKKDLEAAKKKKEEIAAQTEISEANKEAEGT